MSQNIERFVHKAEMLPPEVQKAANAVLSYLKERLDYDGDYTIDGNIAIFEIRDLYNDPVTFIRLIESLEMLPEVQEENIEITHSLDRNALTIAPKGTHIKLDEII